MRGFWMKEDNKTVGNCILKLIEYIETQILLDNIIKNDFPTERIDAGNKSQKLLNGVKRTRDITTEATFENGNINITLQDEIFDHVQSLLNDGHYFNAVEEAYKIVREKLRKVNRKKKPRKLLIKTITIKYLVANQLVKQKLIFLKGSNFCIWQFSSCEMKKLIRQHET